MTATVDLGVTGAVSLGSTSGFHDGTGRALSKCVIFHRRRPSSSTLEAFLSAQERLEVTHRAQSRYVTDHQRIVLGEGEEVFAKAKAALSRWTMLRLGWVEPVRAERPLELGATVGVLVRLGPIWLINACRIVELEEHPERMALAYATLPGHVERGIERFSIEREDGQVVYDLWAQSAPGHILSKIGYPFARLMQRRFRRDSASAMTKEVQGVR